MKINLDKKTLGIYITKLTVGSTFLSKRSNTDEVGLYMVVDKKSGVFLDSYRDNIMAVNLASGQIRAFDKSRKVEPIDTEVNHSQNKK